MEYSEEQKRIIETTDKKVVVVACSSAGKTRCLVARIQYLVDNGTDPTSIVAITYTNAAAAEMRQRLKNCDGIFIGTIHSYCNRILCKVGIDTHEVIDNEEFDELFELIDENPDICPHVKYLIVDEFQDCCPIHYHFLFDILQSEEWMVFGDPRQSIYSFLGSEPSLMINLAKEDDVSVYKMTRNYRNSNRVLDFARIYARKRGRDYIDDSIPMRGIEGNVYIYRNEELPQVLNHFSFKTPSDWFILARTNIQVEYIKGLLDAKGVPNVILRKKDLDNEELLKVLKSNNVIVATVHQAKGLERNNVIAYGLREYQGEEINICYVAITRARNNFYWVKPPQKKTKYRF